MPTVHQKIKKVRKEKKKQPQTNTQKKKSPWIFNSSVPVLKGRTWKMYWSGGRRGRGCYCAVQTTFSPRTDRKMRVQGWAVTAQGELGASWRRRWPRLADAGGPVDAGLP